MAPRVVIHQPNEAMSAHTATAADQSAKECVGTAHQDPRAGTAMTAGKCKGGMAALRLT